MGIALVLNQNLLPQRYGMRPTVNPSWKLSTAFHCLRVAVSNHHGSWKIVGVSASSITGLRKSACGAGSVRIGGGDFKRGPTSGAPHIAELVGPALGRSSRLFDRIGSLNL